MGRYLIWIYEPFYSSGHTAPDTQVKGRHERFVEYIKEFLFVLEYSQ